MAILDTPKVSAQKEKGIQNRRNWHSKKTVANEHREELTLGIPRDRYEDFEPQLVKQHQIRLEGFDDKVIAMYVCLLSFKGRKALENQVFTKVPGRHKGNGNSTITDDSNLKLKRSRKSTRLTNMSRYITKKSRLLVKRRD